MQDDIVITAPTDRSSPPSSTGSVCAMATKPMATDSLPFCTKTAVENPRGCIAWYVR